jgi:outer membrane protein OmpA-like peptidoglycan-associated protein
MSESKGEQEIVESYNDSEHSAPDAAAKKMSASVNPAIILLFMILAMLVVLALTLLKNGKATWTSNLEDTTVAAIKSDLDARRLELNRQRVAMGLAPLDNTSEPVEEIVKRLKADADALAGISEKFQQMLTEKDAELASRDTQTLNLEKLRQDISLKNARLQSELQHALTSSSEAEQLKIKLADSQLQNKTIAGELAALKHKGTGVSDEEYAALKRRYEETLRAKEFHEARAKELEANAAKADLFANSEAELLPAAVELFRRLRKLEGQNDSDLTTEYSKLGVDLGANVLHSLSFETGKSELSAADMEMLSNIAASEVPDGDLTLIIGYASETENLDSNQKLSSRHAIAAAEHFAKVKRPGQLVQAVYFGQTDRFSSEIPDRNQICEVWRIRRK